MRDRRVAHRLGWIRRRRNPLPGLGSGYRAWGTLLFLLVILFGGGVGGLARGHDTVGSVALLVGGIALVGLFAAYVMRPVGKPGAIRASRTHRA
ncbi:hypothetical protein [Nocardioides baekrokdamisoli]|uniref:hypothetical protein n=1 Tax=Nocardioides baekrokdamisoli TaxID=1804624 RepID=UPI000F771E6F|nr:hypothetical protein [Nocardioides baekrokdamisoli]